jgi:hypothetical protein
MPGGQSLVGNVHAGSRAALADANWIADTGPTVWPFDALYGVSCHVMYLCRHVLALYMRRMRLLFVCQLCCLLVSPVPLLCCGIGGSLNSVVTSLDASSQLSDYVNYASSSHILGSSSAPRPRFYTDFDAVARALESGNPWCSIRSLSGLTTHTYLCKFCLCTFVNCDIWNSITFACRQIIRSADQTSANAAHCLLRY